MNFPKHVTVQNSTCCFAQSSDHSLVSEWKYGIATYLHVPNQILCKVANLNWWPVLANGFCSDSKRQHSHFRCQSLLSAQSLGTIYLWNYWIINLNQLHPKLAAKRIANEKMSESDVETCFDRTVAGLASSFYSKHIAICCCVRTSFFFVFKAHSNLLLSALNHLCNWPIINHLILKTWSKFQVLSSHFPQLRLMACLMSIEQRMWEEIIFLI